MAAKKIEPDDEFQRYLYLCKVVAGDFTYGQKDIEEPPIESVDAQKSYHSVVDDVLSPSMFVIFNDNQAYPEYLITFS